MRPISVATAAAVLAFSVSGCVSESADLGQAPPVMLETPQQAIAPPAGGAGDAAVRAKVRQSLDAIGDGDVQSVRVSIYARSARDGEGLRRLLLAVGADPARLTVEPGRWPRDRLVLTRAVAETTPCAAAISPVAPDDPLPSLMSLAHCTQNNNLADMLVDPGDLVAPPRLAAEDGQYLIDGVKDWRKNRSKRLPSQDASTDAGGGGGGFGGGGFGGGDSAQPAAAAPAAAAPAAATAAPSAAAGT